MEKVLADIAVKNKQIQVEVDPQKKAEYQKQLQVLHIRKQIIGLQTRIEQIRA
jgi:hypothetical protein|tara:strand:+ start:3126 stop:3284 length:159 start_codon:yes stop_codon:yes gene_type:complete